jgi:hypothetical protein
MYLYFDCICTLKYLDFDVFVLWFVIETLFVIGLCLFDELEHMLKGIEKYLGKVLPRTNKPFL